ncbi:Glutaminase [Frankliniella fusca]|uniref:Glutaminase n=1 Tax=Frankliniella fusca TaxID=407009 RepID=A0AAE1LRR9_9NEOP|nr:Glutaminase [Frankliniella fusca]
MPNPQNTHARMHARALLKWRASKSTQEVSWLTSLLHADILSSRFDQQANSPGSWTKLALKPLLLKRIQNASLETCGWYPRGGLLTGHLGIHWLSLFNTRTCSKITSGFNVQDVSGVTLDSKEGAKEIFYVSLSWMLGHAGVKPSTASQEDPECILGNLCKN